MPSVKTTVSANPTKTSNVIETEDNTFVIPLIVIVLLFLALLIVVLVVISVYLRKSMVFQSVVLKLRFLN
jgi:E3 ubiquitin-protein ligase DOA10